MIGQLRLPFNKSKVLVCSRCYEDISIIQYATSKHRADNAKPMCKDCITMELTADASQ